jgi:hypothetical protein
MCVVDSVQISRSGFGDLSREKIVGYVIVGSILHADLS